MSEPGSPEPGFRAPGSRAPGDDPATAAARRTLVLFGVAVVAALVALLVVVFGTGGDDVVEREDGAAVADLGPRPGADVDAYTARATDRLRAAEGRRVAVVSLSSYVTETEAETLLGLDDEEPAVELLGWLVALPGGEPAVTTDLDRFRRETVADAEAQLAEIERLLPTVDDRDFAAFYRDELVRYRTMLDRLEDAAVFGAVVVARASDLRALASQPAVRMVDVGRSADVAEDAVVRGIRPEETGTSGEPPVRPT